MGASWSDLFADLGEPVHGHPGEYLDAAARAAQLIEGARACHDGVTDLATGDEQLRGATGSAVATMLGHVDAALGDLPIVIGSLLGVLAQHAERLAGLCGDADAALDRATLRQLAFDRSEADLGRGREVLDALGQQLRWALAAAPGDPGGVARVDALEQRLWLARINMADLEHDRATAGAALGTSQREHGLLAADEAALRAATCESLGQLDLGDLRDPTGWRAAVGTIGDVLGGVWHFTGGALVDLADSVVAAATAALDGRLLDALHHLSDALDAATRIVTAVAVVVIVLGSTVMPGALLLLPAVLAASSAISAADVAATGALAWSQTVHPDTGERVGVVDLLGSAIGAAAGRLGAGRAVAGSRAVKVGALRAAGARGATPTFLRTPAQNATVLARAARGGAVVNPATGRLVAGAARDQLVRRATAEAGARQIQAHGAETIGEVIVPDLASRAAEPALAGALAAVHPDAEAAIDHGVFDVVRGHVEHQVRFLAPLGVAPA